MEVVTKKNMMIFSGRSNPELAREVADHLGMRVGKVRLTTFANGELYARYEESVRGADAFVIQSHLSVPGGLSINDYMMEQLIMIDALKRASAKRIVGVMPFFGYARSDKKTLAREPISARLMADMFLSAGVNRLMSVDLHTGQIQGFLDEPFDHLTAMPLLEGWIQRNTTPGERVIVAPDAGRVRLTEKFASHLGCSMAIMQKHRDPTKSNVSETRAVIGEVDGMDCVIVDDMIDTAGTITGAASLLKEHGARRVYALATHPVLSGPARERLDDSELEAVVVTNTIPIPEEHRPRNLVVLSIAPIVASALQAVFEDASVSELFSGENM